eukprot:gene6843-11004_t
MDTPLPNSPGAGPYKNAAIGPKSFTFEKLTKEMKSSQKTPLPSKSPRGLGGAKVMSPKPSFKTNNIKKVKVGKKINISSKDLTIQVGKDSPSPSPKNDSPSGQSSSPDIFVITEATSPPELPKSAPPPIPLPQTPSTPAPELPSDDEEEKQEVQDESEDSAERPLTPLNRKPSLKKVKQKRIVFQEEEEDILEEDVILTSPEITPHYDRTDSRSFMEQINSPFLTSPVITSPLSHSYSPSGGGKLRSGSSAKLNRLMRLSISQSKDLSDTEKSPSSARSKSNSFSSNVEKYTTRGCSANWKIQMQFVEKDVQTKPQLSHWRIAIHQKRMNINQ